MRGHSLLADLQMRRGLRGMAAVAATIAMLAGIGGVTIVPASAADRNASVATRQTTLNVDRPVTVADGTVNVTSPNGAVAATVNAAGGALGYSATLNRKTVVKQSRLGLDVDGTDWGTNVSLGTPKTISGTNESYPLIGAKSKGTDSFNGAVIPLVKDDGTRLVSVEMRVYDTGIAFRYVLDGSLAGKEVTGEDTTFMFDPSSTIAYQQVTAGTIDDLQNSSTLTTIKDMGDKDITVLPTIASSGGDAYANVTEADVRDWPAIALHAKANGTLSPYYWATDNGKGTFAVSASTLHSPFRVVTLADNLNDLVNSDIITAVNPPLDTAAFPNADLSWIKPGTASWTTIASNNQSYDEIARYIDDSSKAGIDYVLIEGALADASWGTNTAQRFTKLGELVRKGKAEKHPVGIWLWMDYDKAAGVDDSYTATIDYTSGSSYPKNSLQNPDLRRAYLKLVADTGIAGLKIDHIGNETETKVNLYADVLKDAAANHLMIEYHNPLEPTGLNRTYPNEIGREAIRGLQYSYNATEDTLLPFTRYVAGTADYTPLSLSKKSGTVTMAHQIASLVGYTNPYLQISEDPANIIDGGAYHNTLADLIANVPTTWRSSRVLAGSALGGTAAVLRESNDGEYWIAVMNGDKAVKLSIPLDFLPDGTRYHADIYADRVAMGTVSRTVRDVDHATTLTADMAANGGYLARITTKAINDPQQTNRYTIASEADLAQIARHPDATFDLTADITMTKPWTPVETFSGELNGNGHVISNLTVADRNVNGNHSKAFIISNQGSISRLAFSRAVSTRTGSYAQADRVAVLAVTNDGTISQVAVTGARVEGGWRSAPIAAENTGVIADSYVVNAQVRGNWESGGLVAWNSATGQVNDSYVSGVKVTCDVQNAGLLSAYGYAGTRFTGNVVISGSLTAVNHVNIGRINGRQNGIPTYKDNYAFAGASVDGKTVTGTPTDLNGGDKTADEIAQRTLYDGIGWDFANTWTWNDTLRRPLLKAMPNLFDASVPGPSRPQADALSGLLSDYDHYWNYYGDHPGVVDGDKSGVLRHDDDITENINQQAAKDAADDSSKAKGQQNRAVSDAAMNSTETLYDALGPTLGQYYKDGMADGSLTKTSDFLKAMSSSIGTGTAKNYFSHPRPYVDRKDFNGRELDLGGLKDTLDISKVAAYDQQGQYNGLAASGSFPSGHTTYAYTQGTGLAYLLPELGTQIMARTSEAGNNRIVLGVHYPLDIMGGRIAGQYGVASALADPTTRGKAADARTELVGYLIARCKADGHGDTLSACIESTGANADKGYANAFVDAVSKRAITDRASALAVYDARMTYGFEADATADQTPVVPDAAIDLLDNVEAFRDLSREQKRQILAATEGAAGYPLDDSSQGWARIDLAAAYSAKVTIGTDGNVIDVEMGQPAASVVVSDHTALHASIAVADGLRSEGYTADSWKAFAAALVYAKSVDARPDATPDELKAAADALAASVDALKRESGNGGEQSGGTPVVTSTLKAVIEQARAIDSSRYTVASARAVRDAISQAERIVADKSATQREVDGAAANLLKAVAGLVAVPQHGGAGGNSNGGSNGGSNGKPGVNTGSHTGANTGSQSGVQHNGQNKPDQSTSGNGANGANEAHDDGADASVSGKARRLSSTGSSSSAVALMMALALLAAAGAVAAMRHAARGRGVSQHFD